MKSYQVSFFDESQRFAALSRLKDRLEELKKHIDFRASGKIPVLGLHKRQGRVFLSVVKNCSKAELMPILQGRIVEGSDIYTDG